LSGPLGTKNLKINTYGKFFLVVMVFSFQKVMLRPNLRIALNMEAPFLIFSYVARADNKLV